MPQCKNAIICKHFVVTDIDLCTKDDICKFFETGPKFGPGLNAVDKVMLKALVPAKTKRKYKKRDMSKLDDPDFNPDAITKDEFDKARQKIATAEFNKKLDDNQAAALKPLKGLRFKTMTEAQREQVVSIAGDL